MQNFIMRSHRAFSLGTALLLFALALAGCSALRMGYAGGDTFVYWWLNGYVNFDDDQKPWVRRHIGELFSWHRQTQLTRYAQLLAEVRQRLPSGRATPAQVQADFRTIRQHAGTLLEQALPALTDLALSIRPHQIAHLEQKFAADNDKYRKAWLSGTLEDRQALRFKKFMQHAEYWFGDFNAEQKARLRTASDTRPLDNAVLLNERMRRQRELIGMLRTWQTEKPTRQAVTAMLRAYLRRSIERIPAAEHKEFFAASEQGMAHMVALVVNTATPAQREHAMKRLQKLIEDCETLRAA